MQQVSQHVRGQHICLAALEYLDGQPRLCLALEQAVCRVDHGDDNNIEAHALHDAVGNRLEHHIGVNVCLQHLPQFEDLVELVYTLDQDAIARELLLLAHGVAKPQRCLQCNGLEECRCSLVEVRLACVVQVDDTHGNGCVGKRDGDGRTRV